MASGLGQVRVGHLPQMRLGPIEGLHVPAGGGAHGSKLTSRS